MPYNRKQEAPDDGATLRECSCAQSDVRQLLICAVASAVVEIILLSLVYEQSTSLAKTNHWLEATQLPGARIADLLINRWVTTIWHGFAVTAGLQIVLFTSVSFTLSKLCSFLADVLGKEGAYTPSETGSHSDDSKGHNGV